MSSKSVPLLLRLIPPTPPVAAVPDWESSAAAVARTNTPGDCGLAAVDPCEPTSPGDVVSFVDDAPAEADAAMALWVVVELGSLKAGGL